MIQTEQSQRVAILVACHNDAPTIRETIDSLLAEPDTELVVVDDGSTDVATRETLIDLEREGIRVLRQENQGPSAAWMRGLSATTAPYVMPFSSDDLLVRGATARLADALDADPEAAAAWGDLQTFGASSALVPSSPTLCPWVITYIMGIPAYALFRRTSLVEAEGWQGPTGFEDHDLWMRLAAGGYAGVYVPGVSYLYRRDAGGLYRSQVGRYETFQTELRERNSALIDARPQNRRVSLAPAALKILFPLVDRLPLLSPLLKAQLCQALSILFWRGGVRRTAPILAQGLLFRARLLRPRPQLPRGRA